MHFAPEKNQEKWLCPHQKNFPVTPWSTPFNSLSQFTSLRACFSPKNIYGCTPANSSPLSFCTKWPVLNICKFHNKATGYLNTAFLLKIGILLIIWEGKNDMGKFLRFCTLKLTHIQNTWFWSDLNCTCSRIRKVYNFYPPPWGALIYQSEVQVPPSTSDLGVFRW